KEAEKWCEALTRKERDAGRLPFGYEYRLPTEAEWEFAARGGRKSRGYLFSGSNKLIEVAWFDANRGTEDGTREVGGKEKNELGFYDMSGNVREWCHDFYEAYSLKPVTDPMGRGSKVMARGGSWRNNTNGSRVTERASYEPNKADDFIGFRVALAPVLPE
ncbi:MAG: SUMF1/EgtB/PvdO family nonheme iron enzyme, partial [Victivallales bacterium]|nr:SUMF1/EgtB/PvdO family nonheme iron enzyme [Victivallales bacterium]